MNLGMGSVGSLDATGIGFPSSSISGTTSSIASGGASFNRSKVTPWPCARILSTTNLCSEFAYPN